MDRISNTIINAWYRNSPFWLKLLLPISWLYRFIIFLRRQCYQRDFFKVSHFPVPVVIVGNVTLGGVGKTPLVIALTRYLIEEGYRPGIVSRGYGGSSLHYPLFVTEKTSSQEAGDEAVMMAQQLSNPKSSVCPAIVVDPNRSRAVATLLEKHDCNVILSDDGLQHYALGRAIEIAVIDGERRLGNGQCLPAGPLREAASRLKEVDYVICNGDPQPGEHGMQLRAGPLHSLQNEREQKNAADFFGKKIHAVAGIGNPTRFFQQLRGLGLNIVEHPFADHHDFSLEDINYGKDSFVIMTEKDAVKCRAFSDQRHWYLPVSAELEANFLSNFKEKLEQEKR